MNSQESYYHLAPNYPYQQMHQEGGGFLYYVFGQGANRVIAKVKVEVMIFHNILKCGNIYHVSIIYTSLITLFIILSLII